MLISMVVVFGICWLPLNTINFIADLDLFPIYCWQYHHFIFFVCHVMAMSSTCYNPFLYGLHNEAFQKGFVELVPFLRIICGTASVEKHQNNEVAMAQLVQRANPAPEENVKSSNFNQGPPNTKTCKQDLETLSNKTVHLVVSTQSSRSNLKVTSVIDNGLTPENRDSQV
jgi:neuropeptide Y receptor